MKDYNNIISLSAAELSAELHCGNISAHEAAEAYLSRIFSCDSVINAYITVTEEFARRNADSADRILKNKEGGALCGIPFSVKDNIMVKGCPATCASEMLRGFVPPYSAEVCEKLWREGCVLLGKVNLDEFAMGSSCEKSIFGATHNPIDISCSPGGSSGGSAASVASREAAFSLGTDTGGSARQPAAFCGLVAMKPTYGLVSRYGMVEFASSYDQISPVTRNVSDNALVLSAICGHDKKDMTSISQEYSTDFLTHGLNIQNLRVGVISDFEKACDEAVARCVYRVAEKLSGLGAAVDTIALPSPEAALEIYIITSAAEASSNLARYDGIKYGASASNAELNTAGGFNGKTSREYMLEVRSAGFGEEVRRRIVTGTYALSSAYNGDYYRRIKNAKDRLCARVEDIFEVYDIILMPTTGSVAFPLGSFDDSPTNLYGSDKFTVYANLTGCPAITIPSGGNGILPCGVTLMGRRLSEKMLYGTAALLEEELYSYVKAEVRSEADADAELRLKAGEKTNV